MANPKSQKSLKGEGKRDSKKLRSVWTDSGEREEKMNYREERLSVCDQYQLNQNRGKRTKTYQIEKDQN